MAVVLITGCNRTAKPPAGKESANNSRLDPKTHRKDDSPKQSDDATTIPETLFRRLPPDQTGVTAQQRIDTTHARKYLYNSGFACEL